MVYNWKLIQKIPVNYKLNESTNNVLLRICRVAVIDRNL